jgi:hypothetical protein
LTTADVRTDGKSSFTTFAFAAKVKPKTAADLFKVALFKLEESNGLEKATRSDIHQEMRSARRFYKKSMKNNLTNTIDTLLASKEINEPEKGSYALSPEVYEQLQREV